MNAIYNTPTNHLFLSCLCSLCLLQAPSFALVLDVPQCNQEQNQWCWAATSQSVLAFYGASFTQTQIAQYGTGGVNTWNYTYGSGRDPGDGIWRNGVDLILSHFKSIASTALANSLAQADAQNEIDTNGRPIVIRWGWDSGGGHILVLNGLAGNTAYLMDPWYGPTINTYSWVLRGSSHTWTHTLKLRACRTTASADSGGTISPNGSFINNVGDSQAFTANPDANHVVNQWLVDGSVVQTGGTSYILPNIQFNHSVQVTFTYAYTYTINSGAITITKYTGSGGEVIIPSTITGLPVVSIGEEVFYLPPPQYCTNLTSVTIPNSVTNIGRAAFSQCCGLTNVTIPNSVTSIGRSAFSWCTSLTSITIPNSVTSIGMGAFESCTSLTTVTVPNSVTSIPDYAFENCRLLTNVVIPNSITSIGIQAFEFCGSLTGVTIPNSVTSMGTAAFADCTSLTNVTIPNSVTYIGTAAFANCTSLAAVYFPGNAPTVGSYVFLSSDYATVYYLPGTTGWGPTFGGRPTALWNPQAQAVGVRTNQIGFNVTGTANIPLVVETCTNLANPLWVPQQSCTLTNGSIYFTDPQWTSYAARFYRLRSP